MINPHPDTRRPAAGWRLLALCFTLLPALAFGQATTSASQEGAKKSYSLPAGDAAATLKQFVEQSGEQIVYVVDSVRGVQTKAVSGQLSAREALDQMLAETGLHIVQDQKTGALTVTRNGKNDLRAAQTDSDRPSQSVKVEDGVVKMEEVEVTGSRIRGLLGEATPNAIITYTRADLDILGIHNFHDMARYIPQLSIEGGFDPETQGNFGSQFRGTNTTFNDLRGLGSNYSLVLVNGRRLPRLQQYNGFDSQDLNGIPLSAVERVEILPSGASAIYGTNAVTGVINFILRKNYQATELNLSYRNTFESDTAQRGMSLSFGRSMGNFSYSGTLEWSDSNSLAPRDRWWNASADMRPHGGTDGRSTVPSGPGTVRTTNGANLPGLTSSRATIPANSDGRNVTIADYANAGPTPGPTDTLQYTDNARTKNKGVNLRADFEWRSWAKLFVNGRWGEKTAYRPGNYTLPMLGTGVVSRGDAVGPITLPAGYPGNPFGVPIIVEKVFWDLIPFLDAKETSINPSLELGLRGDLPKGWAYEGYIRNSWGKQKQFGALSFSSTSGGTTRFNNAINNPDPTLRPVLLHNSERFSPNSSAVMQNLFEMRPITNRTITWEYGLRADGPLWTIPAGDIRAAVAAVRYEYYIDTHYVPNDTIQNFHIPRSVNGESQDYTAQLQIPLAGEHWRFPLLHSLRLNFTAGGTEQNRPEGSSTVTDLSVIWQPFSWLTLRTSRSESYKLPTLSQAFSPNTTSSTNFPSLAPLIASFRVFDPARGNTQVLYSIPTTSGGNPGLRPQNGETRGASLEIDLPFIPGLKFAAVYSDTNIQDQIVFGTQNFQSIFNFLPDRLTRSALTPADQALGYTGGLVTHIDARNLNLAQFRTSNLDLSLEYRRDFASLGRLAVNVKGTKPIRNYEIAIPGAPRTDFDFRSSGRYTTTITLTRAAWTYGAAIRYDEAWRTSLVSGALNEVPAYTKYDAWVGYDFGKSTRHYRGMVGTLLKDLSLTVRGMDILPQDPQFQRANGYIIGRGNAYQAQYQIDLRKKF